MTYTHFLALNSGAWESEFEMSSTDSEPGQPLSLASTSPAARSSQQTWGVCLNVRVLLRHVPIH